MRVENIIECIVTGFQDYGMFVSCGDYSGLVHISEISDQYVSDISEIFEIGNKVSLYVLEVDEATKKVKLSYKKIHKVHKRILKNVEVQKGFNSLKQSLEGFVIEKKEDLNDN